MSKILIVSATLFEIEALIEKLGYSGPDYNKGAAMFFSGNDTFDVLVTGLGQAVCAYHLGTTLTGNRYRFALNLGIAGSFREELGPGSIVNVKSEIFADLGAETHESFVDIFTMNLEMDLLDKNEFPYTDTCLVNSSDGLSYFPDLPLATSVTVNRILGKKESIRYVREQFKPDVVNMEGASFFFACLNHGIPFAQIRSISDQVGELDRAKWDFKGSIKSLNKRAFEIVDYFRDGAVSF